MSPVLEPKALAVDALSQPWQGHLMYMFLPFSCAKQDLPETWSHSERQGHSTCISPLMAISTVVPTSGSVVCGPSTISSILSGPAVTTSLSKKM